MDEERRYLLAAKNYSDNYRSNVRYGTAAILIAVALERMAFYGLLLNLVLFLNIEPLSWMSYNAVTASLVCFGVTYLISFLGGMFADLVLGRFKTLVASYVIYLCGYAIMPIITSEYFEVMEGNQKNSIANGTSFLYFCIPKFSGLFNDSDFTNDLDDDNNTSTVMKDLSQENCWFSIFLSLILVAVGAGMYRANIAPFGGDQCRWDRNNSSYFNWYYWSINLGTLIASVLVTWIEQDYFFFVGFTLCMAALGLSFLVFLSGCCTYTYSKKANRVLKMIWCIIKEAFQKKRARKSYNAVDELSHSSGQDSTSSQSSFPECFLDYAKFRYGGSYTDTQVNDVKKLFKVLAVFLTLVPYWMLYFQMQTTYLIQGLHLKLNMSASIENKSEMCNADHHHMYSVSAQQDINNNTQKGFRKEIVAAWLTVFDVLFVILLIPLMEKCVYQPLKRRGYNVSITKRISLGMLFASFSIIIAGVLEHFRLQSVHGCDSGSNKSCIDLVLNQHIATSTFQAADMSVFWQLPQYALLGISEVFASVAGLDFAYQMAPKSMKGIIMGLFYLFTGVGSFLSVAIIHAFQHVWFFGNDHGNINCRVNCGSTNKPIKDCHLDYFFFLLGGVQIFGVILFLLVTKKLHVSEELESMRNIQEYPHGQDADQTSHQNFENNQRSSPSKCYGRTSARPASIQNLLSRNNFS